MARAARIGIETVLMLIHTPQTNGVVERLIGTLRRECVDHIIPPNEWHRRQVLREFVVYYNETRSHGTLALGPPEGALTRRGGSAPVIAIRILGGLHHRHEWKAACSRFDAPQGQTAQRTRRSPKPDIRMAMRGGPRPRRPDEPPQTDLA